MQIAVKLSDERTLGLDPRQRIIHQIESDVNTGETRDILNLLNKENVLNRYPPNAFSHRCFSYIPGIEAYPEVMRNFSQTIRIWVHLFYNQVHFFLVIIN